MKKFRAFSALTMSSLLLVGCSLKRGPIQTQTQETKKQPIQLTESVGIDEEEIFEKDPKTGEYTHEMAEADADDISIKQAVGVSEIDDDLNPQKEEDAVPYKQKFLKTKNTKRVQFWVDYFTRKQRDRFQRFINNGEEYRHHIEDIFEKHGLPKELYFVGLIESGYYLGARSHASAVGPWQFIKGTGKRYGLRTTSELDERQDLFKATRAAAAYFKDLHNIFSSWELSLAAYNAGEYGMIRRILKHGTRDYYVLSRRKQLPSETINYVPKVIAAMHVVNNAEKYGFVIPKKESRLFDVTELRAVKKNLTLKSIAKKLKVDEALIKKLNPELRRGKTPRYLAGTYYLRVPKNQYSYKLGVEGPEAKNIAYVTRPETRKELNRRIAEIAERPIEPKKPKYYRVKSGDTLYGVARKYELTPNMLAKLNNLRSHRSGIRIGQRLKVRAPETVVAKTDVEEQSISTRQASPKIKIARGKVYYKIRRGDNLTEIANLFNLKVRELKVANNIKRGRRIQPGQKIVLPDTKKGIYTVKHGDHLYKISKELNRPVEALVKLNSLKRKTIYPGQKLIVNMD